MTVTAIHVPGPVRGKVPAATLIHGKPGPVNEMIKGVSPAVMVTLRLSRLQTALAASGIVAQLKSPRLVDCPLPPTSVTDRKVDV